MKFRFCGDGDCPDWVLMEIPTLTLMTSIKMKLLCGVVAKTLAGGSFDSDRAKGLTADAKFGEPDYHGAVAALGFLLGSAARHSADPDSFSSELQQLGLPREHAQAAAKVLGDHAAALNAHLKSQTLRVSTLEDASCSVVRPSGLGGADADADADAAAAALSLTVRDGVAGDTRTHDVRMTQLQLQGLLAELHRAKALMEM